MTRPDERDLLPCPFCGNLHPTCVDREFDAFIYCDACGTEGPVAFVGEHAEDFWNKREAAAQVPVDEVRIPTSEDEAALMVLLGTNWLTAHAPHRLKSEGAAQASILMAAAPDLLDALRDCLEWIEMADSSDWVSVSHDERAKAQAAISKATGERS